MATAVKLTPGLHEGVVKAYYPPNNTLLVKLKDNGAMVSCQWAAGIVSAMVGFKTSYYPPMKTEVIVWMPSTAEFGYVIGSKPSNRVDGNRQRRTITGNDDANYSSKQIFHVNNSNQNQVFVGHKPPVDLAEGEINIENWMGVGLSLLRNMASLQASDLARVECFLMDDMVRIISDTFRHYTAFGDFKISNDGGKLNVIWNGTKNDFEALGNQRSQDLKARMTSPTSVGDQLNDPNQMDDGRWRFSQYIGWLGNFINVYVTDPVNSLGKIAEGQFRSGKARIHVNDDGAVLVQSVADIVLEKVVRIPVPVQIRKEDDPKGNLSDELLENTDYLKTWNPSDAGNLFEMAFQLREYARWLNNTYSLARFSQMTRDWQVPSEAQTPLQDVNSDETDKTSVNTGVSNWRIAYATIRIYRDGSIQTVDAYGNSITTTAIGIQISTPKNLLLQAGGSVNIVAGRDVNILARNNVGVTSVNAAIRLKSKTALMLFCSAGNVIYEIASSFFHKFIGNITANNTVDITTAGTIDASVSVNTPTLNADTLSATGVTIKNGLLSANKAEVTTINTQTVNVENSNSVSWPGLQNEISSSFSVSVSQLSDIFLFQTEYDGGTLYQTFTQQMLETGDVKTTASIWSFSDNSADGRGAPWPGASAQEMTTSSGDPLNTPSSNTKFSEKPATMTLQSPRLIVS